MQPSWAWCCSRWRSRRLCRTRCSIAFSPSASRSLTMLARSRGITLPASTEQSCARPSTAFAPQSSDLTTSMPRAKSSCTNSRSMASPTSETRYLPFQRPTFQPFLHSRNACRKAKLLWCVVGSSLPAEPVQLPELDASCQLGHHPFRRPSDETLSNGKP